MTDVWWFLLPFSWLNPFWLVSSHLSHLYLCAGQMILLGSIAWFYGLVSFWWNPVHIYIYIIIYICTYTLYPYFYYFYHGFTLWFMEIMIFIRQHLRSTSHFFARLQETSSWSWLVGFPRHVDFSKHPPGLNSRFFTDLTLISWWWSTSWSLILIG